jgi:hypothetical protein
VTSTVAARNLELLDLFMQYTLEHPEMLDRIPPGAELFIMPDSDPELAEANRRRMLAARDGGKAVVGVRVERVVLPRPPEFVNPHVEVLAA